jgi:hypothetical protein
MHACIGAAAACKYAAALRDTHLIYYYHYYYYYYFYY